MFEIEKNLFDGLPMKSSRVMHWQTRLIAKDKSGCVGERYCREPMVLWKRVTYENNSPSKVVSGLVLDIGEEIGLA